MNVNPQDFLQCDSNVIAGFVGIVSVAVVRKQVRGGEGEDEDIALVLDAVRVLRPNFAELDVLEAMLHISRRRWAEAIHVLSQTLMAAPDFPYTKVLMALCHAMNHDPSWTQWSSEVLAADPDRNTRRLLQLLELRDRLEEGARNGCSEVLLTRLAFSALGNDD